MYPYRVQEQLGLLQKYKYNETFINDQKIGTQLQNKQMWKNINKENWINGRRANVHRKNRVKYR